MDPSGDLQRAASAFAGLEMPLEAGRCHLLLGGALAGSERDRAVEEARLALSAFERLGAARDADAAAALLRDLGVRAARRVGSGLAGLTRRECEVLELVARGRSNREIAAELFLSPKTVEHHVRSVLLKLDVSNRAQAAAYAARHSHGDSALE